MAPKTCPRCASTNAATCELPSAPNIAIASNRDTAEILFPYTSAQAFTVVKPTRTPVNDPGPAATEYPSTFAISNPEACSTLPTAGSSQDE